MLVCPHGGDWFCCWRTTTHHPHILCVCLLLSFHFTLHPSRVTKLNRRSCSHSTHVGLRSLVHLMFYSYYVLTEHIIFVRSFHARQIRHVCAPFHILSSSACGAEGGIDQIYIHLTFLIYMHANEHYIYACLVCLCLRTVFIFLHGKYLLSHWMTTSTHTGRRTGKKKKMSVMISHRFCCSLLLMYTLNVFFFISALKKSRRRWQVR